MVTNIQGGCDILKPIKWYKKLHSVKGRIDTGYFSIEGPRGLKQILQNYPLSIKEVLIDENHNSNLSYNCSTRLISSKQFSSISAHKTHQGVIGIISLPKYYTEEQLPGECGKKILVLEDVQDPGNIGTLIRTAVAFNFNGVILSTGCADPFSPKAIQSSAGAILSLWLRRTSCFYELVRSLKERQFRIVSAHVESNKPVKEILGDKTVLVMGNEGNGISDKMLSLSDNTFTIPFNSSQVESLNVASAGAICMFLTNQKKQGL